MRYAVGRPWTVVIHLWDASRNSAKVIARAVLLLPLTDLAMMGSGWFQDVTLATNSPAGCTGREAVCIVGLNARYPV